MIVLRRVDNRLEARRSEKYFKSGFGRRQIERLLRLEPDGGDPVLDAEREGLLRNPFAVSGENMGG